jgi:hypothetical protein
MNATHSRLTCEHCHGTGYITTALGKLPCLTCSASEVRNRQESSEVVSNRKEAPLVKELCPVAKNPTNFSRSIEPRLIFGVGKSGNRTVVQVPTVALDGESGIPFAQIKTKNDFKDLDGNYEFVGLHVGIEVGAVLFARMLATEQSFDSSWTLISAPQKPHGMSELIPVPAGGPIQEAKE